MAWSDPATELDFTDTEVVTAVKLDKARDNFKEVWRELAYVEFTSDVTPGASEGSPADVVSSGAITYTPEPILVEFFSPHVDVGTAAFVQFNLWDASTNLGRIGTANTANSSAALVLARRLTPTAASHTYKIRANGSGTTAVGAGAGGGAGIWMPGFIRITQKGGV